MLPVSIFGWNGMEWNGRQPLSLFNLVAARKQVIIKTTIVDVINSNYESCEEKYRLLLDNGG